MKKKYDIILIGAGIFGTHSAIELKNHFPELNIGIIEKKNDIFKGASGNNTGRVHLGYHYPRDIETALQSKYSYDVFIKYYKDCIIKKFPNYYFIVNNDESKTSDIDYLNFLENIDLPFTRLKQDQISKLDLNQSLISIGIQTEESVCDLDALKKNIQSKLKKNIDVHFNEEVINVSKEEEYYVVQTKDQTFRGRFVILSNYMNPVGNFFGTPNNFFQENTEILEIEFDRDPYGITLLDGPFISLLPLGSKKNRFSLYSVTSSRYTSYPKSEEILIDAISYIPSLQKARVIKSLLSVRSLERDVQATDRRLSKLHKIHEGLFFVQSGKLDHIFLIGNALIEEVKSYFESNNAI